MTIEPKEGTTMKTAPFNTIARKLGALTVLAAAVMTSAQARDFHFFVSGSGSAQGSERESTLDEAYEKASEQARLVCAGGNGEIHHDRIDRTGSNCARLGASDNPVYACMVFVRADCLSRVR